MSRAATPIVLDDRALLDVWEQAANVPPVWRPAAVVAAVAPDLEVPAERLPIGARDAVLLAVRVGTVGSWASAVVMCPDCGQDSDVEVDAASILSELPCVQATPAVTVLAPERVDVDGVVVAFRCVDTTDLAAVTDLDPDAAAGTLLERCLLTVDPPGSPVGAALADAVAARMAVADPASDIRLRIVCAECGHARSVSWDVAEYLWQELEVAARAVVLEVDALARRYGWRESDVLAMTRARRRTYLELA